MTNQGTRKAVQARSLWLPGGRCPTQQRGGRQGSGSGRRAPGRGRAWLGRGAGRSGRGADPGHWRGGARGGDTDQKCHLLRQQTCTIRNYSVVTHIQCVTANRRCDRTGTPACHEPVARNETTSAMVCRLATRPSSGSMWQRPTRAWARSTATSSTCSRSGAGWRREGQSPVAC